MVVFHKKHNSKLCTLAVFVFMACGLNANAVTYYVNAQGGDDGNNGQSLTTAWRTLGKANSAVQPGDTVLVRGGTYNETIRPGTSGTQGNYITYVRYNNEEAVITDVYDAVDLRNKNYVVIDGLKILNVDHDWINMEENANHNIVQNCHMEEASGWAGISIVNDSNYNKIINNVLIGYVGPDDLIYIRNGSDYNVVEGNDLKYAPHYGVNIQVSSYYNVVRNNRVWNPWHGSLGTYTNSHYTLFEDNIMLDSGEDAANIPPAPAGRSQSGRDATRNWARHDHAGMQIGASNCIVRRNIFVNNGVGLPFASGGSNLYNHVYSNTHVLDHWAVRFSTRSDSGYASYGNVFRNDNYYNNQQYGITYFVDDTVRHDNYFLSDNVYLSDSNPVWHYSDGFPTISTLESKYPAEWQGSIQQDPLFVNENGVNDYDNSNFDPQSLRLQSGSRMIDAGTHLTTATSAGNGTSIPVDDASYFYDGWGIPGEQGDLIQLEGQSQTARITSIDYDNNWITVDRTLSWSVGQGVSLPYQGSAPDIGAFEYASTTTTYTLSTSATHGSVTPSQGSYTAGTSVTLQAMADSGYEFTGWSADLSGSTNPASLTMNADKSVTANFAEVAPTTYTLSASGTNGSVTKTPEKASYSQGETVTLTATPSTGYSFASWSGDASGTSPSTAVTMDGNKSVTANFTANTYTLTASGVNGAVAKTPEKASYSQGETVTLTATPSTGYSFSSWSGDASGTSPSTAVTMDGNKSVTANFTANTYTLTASGVNGAVAKTPEKASYNHGETVTLTATASTGYSFASWSGDASGTSPSTTVTMDSNRSVTANCAINTYTLTAGGTNGSVMRTPDKTSYTHGETVTVTAVPSTGYEFVSWSGDLTGGTTPATFVMDTNKSVVASFRAEGVDETPPVVVASSPEADAIQVPLNSLVTLHVSDDGDGVDADTVTISINGELVYSGDVASYASASGVCRRTGTEADYRYTYQSGADFGFDETIAVSVNASDLSGNVMGEHAYSFDTEMLAFGVNQGVSQGPENVDKDSPSTAHDSSGNIWVVWHAGPVGQRDIYASTMGADEGSFADPLQLTTDSGDQCNPDIAIGPDDKLYVVWEDNRQGNWDVYLKTSLDGASWSTDTRITNSDDGQTAPVIGVDSASGCHVAWEDDAEGQQDIYVASSSDGFVSETISQVTSDTSDQTGPDIAVDASGSVYLVWTDARNGSDDIYGAASNGGPWTNIAVVTGAGHQYAPALATEDEGAWLHVVWADDVAGDSDVYYASSEGMPSSPLARVNIVDDTSGVDQLTPILTTSGSAGNALRVFVCWQDWRNVTLAGEDTDLYFVEVRNGDEINVLVGDGGTGSDQSAPAIGVDSNGSPYIVWTDDRNTSTEIYCAGTTFWDPDVLDSQAVTASEGGTVGIASPSDVGDVSVVIPPQASSQDVTISIAEIRNPQATPSPEAVSYEFGPSGLEFVQPVTITVPYAVDRFGDNPPEPYWYDSRTDSLSQEGITHIEVITISPTVRAVRFRTTHFTPYYLVPSGSVGSAGGSSGGGCSVSPTGDGAIAEFLLPYVGLAGVMLMLRRRDWKLRRATEGGRQG